MYSAWEIRAFGSQNRRCYHRRSRSYHERRTKLPSTAMPNVPTRIPRKVLKHTGRFLKLSFMVMGLPSPTPIQSGVYHCLWKCNRPSHTGQVLYLIMSAMIGWRSVFDYTAVHDAMQSGYFGLKAQAENCLTEQEDVEFQLQHAEKQTK